MTPEIYPTAVRATGAGWAAGFGRTASILAPLAVPSLLAAGGNGAVVAVFAAFFVLAAGAALGLPELRGQALEEGTSAPGDPVSAGDRESAVADRESAAAR